MSDKILLIDGHSILNRAFYGLPDLTSPDGRHTNAVYGFLNILFKILDEEKPRYLAVAFDVHAPTFRHKMYPEYKGTRHPMPEELREQVPLMQDVLRAMGVDLLMMEGYEADDILGTAARRSERKDMDVTILSGDRDLLQLATDRTVIRIPKTRGGSTTVEDYHASDVVEKYGITPEQVIEIKSLMGDSADNIPGVPGIGEKTAKKILQQFGTLENAREHLGEITPKRARENLEAHYDLAVLSKKLATIDTDAPVDLNYEEAVLGNLFTDEAYALFRELGFKKLLPRFHRDGDADSTGEEIPHPAVICTPGELDALTGELRAKSARVGLAALCSRDPKSRRVEVAGIAVAAGKKIWYAAAHSSDSPEDTSLSEGQLIEAATQLADSVPEVCFCDLKGFLAAVPVRERKGLFDISIANYLLRPQNGSATYDEIAAEYAGLTLPTAEEIFASKKLPPVPDMAEDRAARYAGMTAYAALCSAEPLREKLRETGMEKLFEEIEMPLVFTLYGMEEDGICLKKEELIAYGERLSGRISELERSIWDQAGEEFNINSPKQLGTILFERMGLQGGKKTKTGYSTAASVLEKLAPEAPIVRDILDYRQLTKLKSTYADGLAGFVADDGRVHSVFNQTVTATGRISSTDPNLQNIPVRTDLGRELRKVFVAGEGCVFVDADYSQIELRVLASMSGDEGLIEAYREQKDIHAITASKVFHVPFDEVTPQQRRNAKAVNFGIVYGISSFGLSQDLSISRKEAQDYISEYFRTYPQVKSFLDGLVSSAKERGWSETLYGRRRPIPELRSKNFMERQFGERVAMNAPIQGTAADIIKIAMNRVRKRLSEEGLRARLLLQIHDELLIEAPEEEEERVARILREEMTGAADMAVELEVDLNSGRNWYEAH